MTILNKWHNLMCTINLRKQIVVNMKVKKQIQPLTKSNSKTSENFLLGASDNTDLKLFIWTFGMAVSIKYQV